MIRRSLFAIPLVLAACTPQQVLRVQTEQAKIEAAITAGCKDANLVAVPLAASPLAAIPTVQSLLAFEWAGCGTSEAVAALVTKAVNDPSTIAWVERLRDQLDAAKAKAKA